MKSLFLILLLAPILVEAQMVRRSSYIGQEYDSLTNTYWFVRRDFPPASSTKQYFYGVRGMQSMIIFPDTLRLWNYRGKNHGTIDTLLHIRQGVIRQSTIDQLDVARLGGTFPVTRLSGVLAKSQLPSLGFSDLTGTATLSQLPVIPLSQTSGSLDGSRLSGTVTASAYTGTLPFTSITGVATVAQLPTIPYTYVGTGRAKTYPTRTFGTAFTPSTTRDVFVKYVCSITATMSLTSGQSGIIYLESSTNGTTWVEEDRMVNSNSGALTIGLNLVQSQTGALSAVIPAGVQVRVRSTGTATNVLVSSVETVL